MDNAAGLEGEGCIDDQQRLLAILLRIGECRQSLERLWRELGSLTHPRVVALSRELDGLILELYSGEASAEPKP